MVTKNEMQTIREALLGVNEGADRRKLDMLVRQGMMSPASLPMLHRGLDKLQAGKTLNPMERDAVAKVVDSLMYIVTGDDTVFQKAKQHTQKTRYQTEDYDSDKEHTMDPTSHVKKEGDKYCVYDMNDKKVASFDTKAEADAYAKKNHDDLMKEDEQLDEYGNYQVGIKGQGGTTVKARSDKEASQKAFKNMGIADRHRKTVQHTVTKMKEDEEYDNEGGMAKKQLTTLADAAQELMGMLSDTQNLPEWVQSKITKATDYLDTARDYMKSEGDNGKAPVGEEIEEDMESTYKDKFAAMLKKTGKSLAQMSDEEKKKFFNSVDAAHKAKNEDAVDEGAMSRMATQSSERQRLGPNKVKGTGLSTFKKKPAPKNTMVASPKTQRVKMTTAKAAERMVKKGAVYAEDSEETVDEAMTPAQRAAADARRSSRSSGATKGMATTKRPGHGTTKAYKGTGAGDEKHGGHIVMQLRKAVSINKPVKFKDGTTKPVSKAHAHKFLSKYNAGKPAEKEAMHSGHDSHDAFMKHINN